MKLSDAFGVIIRVIGLLIVIWGVDYLYGALVSAFYPALLPKKYPPMAYIHFGVFKIVFVLALISLARFIQKLAYPSKNSDTDTIKFPSV